jgi:hypothetical protein
VVASVVVAVAIGGEREASAAASVFQGLTLIVILQVSEARRWMVLSLTGIAVAVMLLATALAYWWPDALGIGVPLIWIALLLATMLAIARHIRTYDSVSIQVVLGLLTVYLLVGLLFAYTFMLVAILSGEFFAEGQRGLSSFVYFSYVTLATVGYGDLVAAEGWPWALAIAEAVIGQLYLVSIVALAVGRFGRQRPVRKE